MLANLVFGEIKMSSIKIVSLSPAGLEMMQSPESFLTELGDAEDAIYGGKVYSDSRVVALSVFTTPACIASVIASNIVTNTD
ncbi:hypothetical protein QGP82_07980 [Leptothoe sp. LEGE 181152]|nr:hypothetical protein [Adonisia turfae]MDV3348621.1 hypothetical protein [Leptothoe sp. LEGE 181152]